MPNYRVDSKKAGHRCTGITGLVPVWVEQPGGGRRPSDEQARDEDTGFKLWTVEVMYPQVTYGRAATVVANVQVPSVEQPQVQPMAEVTFEGLRVEVRSNKQGQLFENWFADGISGAAGAPARARTGASGGEGS